MLNFKIIETFALQNNEQVLGTGLKCGTGAVPCLIVEPGSFYFSKLSDSLKEIFTFYTFDDLWTCENNATVNIEAIKEQNIQSLIAKVAKVVHALKQQFNYEKIGLMGFSAPGLVAIAAAKQIGIDHIEFVIGSGIAANVVDPEFKATNDYFKKYADEDRKKEFANDEQVYKALPSNLSRLTFWQETIRSIKTKQIYDYKNQAAVKELIESWSYTPDNKIMCEEMRQHYFTKILAEISPQQLISDLVATQIPFLLVYGKRDFTIPPPKKAEREKWKMHENFMFRKYEQSIHYPSGERGSQKSFDDDVKMFLNKYEISNDFDTPSSGKFC